jgi:hypothetical protein
MNSFGDETEITTTNRHCNLLINKKALKKIFQLLIGFYISWMPLILYFIYYACDTDYNDLAVYLVMFIACFNSALNPILYCLNDSEVLRKKVKRNSLQI